MMTEFSTVQPTDQILTFLYAFLLGSLLCSFYDGLRGFRKVFPPNKILLFGQDFFFCAASAIVVFCFLLIRCDGQLRIYALLGIAVGFWIFRITVGHLIATAWKTIFQFARKTIQIIHAPFHLLFKKIRRFSSNLFMKCKNILKRKKKPLAKRDRIDV